MNLYANLSFLTSECSVKECLKVHVEELNAW